MGVEQTVTAFHPQDASYNKNEPPCSAVEDAAPVTTQDPFLLEMGDL